jgi:allophanate hydrolase subunit 1
MRKPRTALLAVAIAGSFLGLAATIIVMSAMDVISHTVAKLMLVALLGLYLGFGFLIAVYQLMRKLD